FSSRGRHTRSYGDWSSDVCSSDLERRQAAATPRSPARSCWNSAATCWRPWRRRGLPSFSTVRLFIPPAAGRCSTPACCAHRRKRDRKSVGEGQSGEERGGGGRVGD